jgi:bifunctional DNA-binding transcriptional regulator/antitoxin component of YhaV-PrlF toxin-antitoxin module
MRTVTLSTKGQLTLNKSLMEYLGIKSGGKVNLTKTADGGLKILPEKSKGSAMDFAGFFKTDIHLTDDEINQCIADSHAAAAMQGIEK